MAVSMAGSVWPQGTSVLMKITSNNVIVTHAMKEINRSFCEVMMEC